MGVHMSDPRTKKPAKVELATIHRRQDGTPMLTVFFDGKAQEYEMSKRRVAFLLTQCAADLAKE
jgi:hypothetical protein